MPALLARVIPAAAVVFCFIGLLYLLDRANKSPIKPTLAGFLAVLVIVLVAVLVVVLVILR